MALVKYGAGAVLFAGALAIGSQALKEDRAEAVARFALTEAELPLMTACEDTVSRHNIEFRSGVENITGCGCIARQVADGARGTSLAVLTDVAVAVIAGGDPDTTTELFEADMRRVQTAHGLSEDRLRSHVDQVGDAIAVCSRHESHMTGAELDAAAAEKDAAFEKSKVAMEQAVAAGHMTRAEAEARLARLKP